MKLEEKFVIRKWGFLRRALFRGFHGSFALIIKKMFKYEVIGIENLKKFPEGQPVIFAANHRSHLDALVFGTAIIPIRRYCATIAPSKVMKENKLFSFTRFLGAHPLDAEDPEPALHYFLKTLENNLAIIIFPQGGRLSRTPLQDYKSFSNEGRSGVGRLVLRSIGKIPVIPCYLHGTAETLSKGQIFPRFGTYLSVTFGEPIYFDQYKMKKPMIEDEEFFKTAHKITSEIMVKIQKLLYETEKDYFSLIEHILSNKIDQINLSESQEKKLRYLTKKLSHLNPNELNKLLK
ncbi:MAG: hypothetical protein HeimC3_22830 [Candidatus Heimdallarchaeota archaeon LC_3]|nr:MAG: hypothetical protein HeimC3_22830 [Candidatus Heimdallarchaeota archaeon LC_3]